MTKPKVYRRYIHSIYKDILLGINLKQHLKDIEEAISEVDYLIAITETHKEKNESFKKIKNDLYYLKYLILEKS